MRDKFGAVALFRKATVVTYPALWMLVKHGPTSKYSGALLIDVEQAKSIRDTLDTFIKENS